MSAERSVAAPMTRAAFRAHAATQLVRLRAELEADACGLSNAPAERAARRDRAHKDFEFFCRTYFPHYIKKDGKSLFQAFAYSRLPEIADSPKGHSLVIAAPRGEAKTTVVTQFFTMWCVVTGRKHFAIVISDTFDQADFILNVIKTELEYNRRLALDFPEQAGKGSVWCAGELLTRSGGKVIARGARQRIRGLRHGPYRPDIAILDDLENPENVRNPDYRKKLQEWIEGDVIGLSEAGATMDTIYVGTTLHADCVLLRTAKSPYWEFHKFQSLVRLPDRLDLWDVWAAIVTADGVDAGDAFYAARREAMERGAEVSWGAWPLLDLMKLRHRNKAVFDRERQNQPHPEDAAFGAFLPAGTPQPHWVYVGAVDPSLGRGTAGDPSAILVGGYDRATGALHVLVADVARRKPDEIIRRVTDLSERYGCLWFAVEAVQFQAYFASQIAVQSAAEHRHVPVVEVKPLSDKTLRIEAMQPHLSAGIIRIDPALTALCDQLTHWPETDHDDALDALEMLWQMARRLGAGRPGAGGRIAVALPASDAGHTGYTRSEEGAGYLSSAGTAGYQQRNTS